MTDLPRALPRNPVNFRSVALGLAGTLFICGLTPYNDYALNNTFLVGNNLPIGVILLLFLFTVCINGPLHALRGRWALGSGELTVALAMMLTSCCLPSSGLMRYFPPSLVAPLWHAQSDIDDWEVLRSLHLKTWLFPTFQGHLRLADAVNDPIVYGYLNGVGPVPWRAWLTPLLTWGIFLFALYGALMCMVAMVRRQWMENERLAFPLASIYLSLVEKPAPGTSLAPTLRKRSFWIAFSSVFFIHLWNGLAKYYPQFFPPIPVFYDLTKVLKDRPWEYAQFAFKYATIYFSAVGVTYFLSSSVSFSLWFFFVAEQIWMMTQGMYTGDPANYGRADQHIGGVIAFFLSVLWIGRAHWRMVLAQAFRGRRPAEPAGRYLSYRAAFWLFVFCIVVMIEWLHLAGSSIAGAAAAVLLLICLFFVITRIIAETGLIHGQLQVPLNKTWDLCVLAGWKDPVSVDTYYLTTMLNAVHYDYREVMPVYASHAMKVADSTMYKGDAALQDTPDRHRGGRAMIAAMFFALVAGYAASACGTLWTQYHHGATLDVTARSPINDWGIYDSKWFMLYSTSTYLHKDLEVQANPAVHIPVGFVITAILAFMRLRFTGWPLHPIGFIMLDTFPTYVLWFSIFLGWVAKTLIVRFGGARLYLEARPFFLGMIVGEAMAAALWLGVGVACGLMNVPFRPVHIMPG